jgi:lipoprotein-anchoring transpeptidase ErfK/SrfK
MPSTLFQAEPDGLTRRDFIKRSGAGLAAWFIRPNLNLIGNPERPVGLELPCQGRVLVDQAALLDQPSAAGRLIQTLNKDEVYAVLEAAWGENLAQSQVWYRLDGGGYIHSTAMLPMQVRVNLVEAGIPQKGAPAEVSVPFTDSIWNVRPAGNFAYRLYYGSTFWIDRVVKDEAGNAWYRIADQGEGPIYYYARAEHLHVLAPEEISPLSPEVPAEAKRIEVRLKEQVVVCYEHDRPVMMTQAATGAKFAQKNLSTPIGRYFTNYKFPSSHMVHPDRLEENAYDLPGVPWVIYLTTTGVAFHGTYWHNDYGKPRSHGCINLNLSTARWLYRWSVPGVPYSERSLLTKTGTIVDIF